MTEVKKLTDEEIQKINDLQQKREALVTELGQVNLAKLNLEERENKAREFYGELLVEETIKQIEALLTEYFVPLAYVDGQRLMTVAAMDTDTIRTQDLLSCIVNQDQVLM